MFFTDRKRPDPQLKKKKIQNSPKSSFSQHPTRILECRSETANVSLTLVPIKPTSEIYQKKRKRNRQKKEEDRRDVFDREKEKEKEKACVSEVANRISSEMANRSRSAVKRRASKLRICFQALPFLSVSDIVELDVSVGRVSGHRSFLRSPPKNITSHKVHPLQSVFFSSLNTSLSLSFSLPLLSPRDPRVYTARQPLNYLRRFENNENQTKNRERSSENPLSNVFLARRAVQEGAASRRIVCSWLLETD